MIVKGRFLFVSPGRRIVCRAVAIRMWAEPVIFKPVCRAMHTLAAVTPRPASIAPTRQRVQIRLPEHRARPFHFAEVNDREDTAD